MPVMLITPGCTCLNVVLPESHAKGRAWIWTQYYRYGDIQSTFWHYL